MIKLVGLIIIFPVAMVLANPRKSPSTKMDETKPRKIDLEMPNTSDCVQDIWDDDASEIEFAKHKKRELECKEEKIAEALVEVRTAQVELADWRRREKNKSGTSENQEAEDYIDYRPLKGIQLAAHFEHAANPRAGLSRMHVYLELGFLKHGNIMATVAVAPIVSFESRSVREFGGLRGYAGYVFDNGLTLAFGFGYFGPHEISETYRVGYLDEAGFNASVLVSGFRFGDNINTVHLGFALGVAI